MIRVITRHRLSPPHGAAGRVELRCTRSDIWELTCKLAALDLTLVGRVDDGLVKFLVHVVNTLEVPDM